MERVLIIAIGNPLRSDDGIAWAAAQGLDGRLQHSVEIMCVHQLTPELGEAASHVHTVIFMDASRSGEPGKITCEEILPQPGQANFSHSLSPCQVLAISEWLYGVKPRGFVVSVSGECFDHGNKLSDKLKAALPEIETMVFKLASRSSQSTSSSFPKVSIVTAITEMMFNFLLGSIL